MVKKFLKEGLIVFVLTIVFTVILDFGGDFLIPAPSGGDIASGGFMILALGIALILFLIPVLAAVIGGYLISKKEGNLLEALLVPAIAVVAAILILLLIDVLLLLLTPSETLAMQLEKAAEYGANIFENMSLDEVKSFLVVISLISGAIMGALYFGLGAIGALVGRFAALRRL